MNPIGGAKIEKILLESGVLSSEQWEQVRSIQARTGQDLESILTSEGILKQKELLNLLAVSMGVEFIDLEYIIINSAAIGKLSGEIAARYYVFPFDIRNNMLFLAMRNPDDLFVIDEIKMFTQMEIKPFLGDGRLIGKAISHFYGVELKPDLNAMRLSYRGTDAGKSVKISSIIGRNSQRLVKTISLQMIENSPDEMELAANKEQEEKEREDAAGLQEGRDQLNKNIETDDVKSEDFVKEENVKEDLRKIAVEEEGKQGLDAESTNRMEEVKENVNNSVECVNEACEPEIVESHEQESLEDTIRKLVENSLKIKHVSDVNIDMANRTLKVTLTVKF